MYISWFPLLRLDDSVKPESVENFGTISESTVDAINNHERSRQDLRRAAKELVRRRRARQAMGGPKWEVFVSKTVKVDDGDGNRKG
jgi:hypothetical protein